MQYNFLGREVAYWADLQKRFETEVGPTAEDLLQEILLLRGKVSFYEARIKEMSAAMTRAP